jgi:hypothetical protein
VKRSSSERQLKRSRDLVQTAAVSLPPFSVVGSRVSKFVDFQNLPVARSGRDGWLNRRQFRSGMATPSCPRCADNSRSDDWGRGPFPKFWVLIRVTVA